MQRALVPILNNLTQCFGSAEEEITFNPIHFPPMPSKRLLAEWCGIKEKVDWYPGSA